MPVLSYWSELCIKSAASVSVFDFTRQEDGEHKCTWKLNLYVGNLSHEHDPPATFGTLMSSAVSRRGRDQCVWGVRGVRDGAREGKSKRERTSELRGPVTHVILSSLTLMGAQATRVPSDRRAISVGANAPLSKLAPPNQSWSVRVLERVFFLSKLHMHEKPQEWLPHAVW